MEGRSIVDEAWTKRLWYGAIDLAYKTINNCHRQPFFG
jgi:hypothetical protein